MGKKILLADDSITIQKVIELTFSDEDFEVVTVGNGRLAMEKVQEVRPDIVLCDIIMPEKDGYEVCEFVKKSPSLSHVPVLLLTGAFEPFDQERAARVGADGSLAKPFEPETLIAKVKDLLRKAVLPPSASHPPRSIAPAAPRPSPPEVVTAPNVLVRPPEAAQTQAFPAFARPTAVPPVPASPPPPAPLPPPVASFEAAAARVPAAEPVLTPEPEVSFIPDEPFGVLDAASFAAAPVASAPQTAGASARTFDPDLYAPAEEALSPDLVEVTPEESASLSAPPAVDSTATVMFKAGGVSWGPPTIEVALEERARAAIESPPEEPPALDEVFEEEAVEVSPTTMRNVVAATPPSGVVAAAPPTPAVVEFPFMATASARPPFEPSASREAPPAARPPVPPRLVEPKVPEWLAETPPLVPAAPVASREPEPASFAAAAPAPEASSFADVAAAVGEPASAPAAASIAAEVAVPVDMVEKIAQRVVAQISEKVIQQIAWEVIPDLAEALIKKEIERLKAELQEI